MLVRLSRVNVLWTACLSSHALPFHVDAGLFVVLLTDQLLNTLVLVRAGHILEVSTMLTWNASYFIGMVCMREYAKVRARRAAPSTLHTLRTSPPHIDSTHTLHIPSRARPLTRVHRYCAASSSPTTRSCARRSRSLRRPSHRMRPTRRSPPPVA